MECAVQLAARGHEVPLVALFDTWVPRAPLSFVEKVAFRASELRRFSWEERARWISFQLMRRLGPPEPVLAEELPLIDAAASERLGRQALEWCPPSYSGDLILFRAEVDLRGYSTPPGALGWEKLCPHVSMASLDCDHTQMMREPQAERIAARLIDELRQRHRA
jgi:thioesterase domain-containing protein